MIRRILLATLIVYSLAVSAQKSQIRTIEDARQCAMFSLEKYEKHLQFAECHLLTENDTCLAFIFDLLPSGYAIVPVSTLLPSLLAYSVESNFGAFNSENPLFTLVKSDLSNRLKYYQTKGYGFGVNSFPPIRESQLFEQWPSTGEGWLKTNYTQNAPYNDMCPMDPVTSVRSYAGCPAVAMAQILNFHKTTNNTHFDDGDDYWHGYMGRNYQIDDEHASVDFPSFPELNAYLDTLNAHYQSAISPTNDDKAALVFACGVACTQVFTSEGSGTFGVNQAFDAYQRFNFTTSALLIDSDPDLFERLKQNIKDTLPAHLAIVDPGWSTGHNIVVDGYNTDNYYHVNFGWGGSYNGWYLLPEELPYNLTVIEGLIVDINLDTTTTVRDIPLAEQLDIYPNPCYIGEALNISSNTSGKHEYYIYNACGTEVTRGWYIGKELTLSSRNLRPGLYLVKVDNQELGKIVINR